MNKVCNIYIYIVFIMFFSFFKEEKKIFEKIKRMNAICKKRNSHHQAPYPDWCSIHCYWIIKSETNIQPPDILFSPFVVLLCSDSSITLLLLLFFWSCYSFIFFFFHLLCVSLFFFLLLLFLFSFFLYFFYYTFYNKKEKEWCAHDVRLPLATYALPVITHKRVKEI